MEKIKAIIFDWGGVLAEDPAPGLARYCSNALGVGVDEYQLAYDTFMDDFMTGRVTEQQFWMNMTTHLNVPMPKVSSLWNNAFAAVYVSRKELFSLAAHLRKNGCKIALLSNTEKPAVEFFHRQNYDIFDVTVFSCLEGIKKPQKEIYGLALNRLDTSAGQTLFIDDRQDYIAGAKQAGLHTILFKNVEQLKKDLVGFGFNVV
jgi:epoxide hydrolase-like predicted phosphatase